MYQKLKGVEKVEQVAKLRRFKGWTQTDMANILGISLQGYWKKENGITKFSDSEKVKLLEVFREDFPDLTIDKIFYPESIKS